jgi:anti-sigma factor RsiW
VLRAHALLSRASVEVGLESQGNLDLVAFQLAQAIGPAVKFPDLQPQGFKFVRAKLLRFGDRPLAQILYLGAEGAPLTIYAMRGSGDGEPAFRQEGAIGFVSWKDDGIAYLLAGEEDETALFRLAEKIKHEPAAPDTALTRLPRSEVSQVPAEPGAPAPIR